MSNVSNRFLSLLPRSHAEVLDETARVERRHDGPFAHDPGVSGLREIAARRRLERNDAQSLLRADLRRFERVRAEHLRWLRISVRQFRAVLRLPESANRSHQLAYAQDAVRHNKESVRIWAAKVADARAKLERQQCRAVAAE